MNLKKKNIRDLFLCRWCENRKIRIESLSKFSVGAGVFLVLLVLFVGFMIYIPANPFSHETITYTVIKGWGDDEIAKDLEKAGIIRSDYFFRLYVVASFKHSALKAGKYNLSSRMSAYQIATKLANGDVIKNKITIFEGWDIKDTAKYFAEKGICQEDEFLADVKKDYSKSFGFLKEKPAGVSLEGYLFPDTYEIAEGETCEDVLHIILQNFDAKISPEIKAKTISQKKSLFDIITMASIIEKEVKKIDDKKIVSGILWKRLDAGMPLQLDSTVNYITNKNDPGVAIKDTKIDSPYNTYKYKGLPMGPISNPGIESILAALNPTKTAYWFYLSSFTGKTIFSKNFAEHTLARTIYR